MVRSKSSLERCVLTGSRYVDFYDDRCKAAGEPGTLTVSGQGDEYLDECRGGPRQKSGADASYAVGINGITDNDLVVAKDCPDDSFLSTVTEDDCIVIDETNPIRFVKVRTKAPEDEEEKK
ncbi:MAG: hypothetical protein Q9210_004421 [Variospora velana]